MDQILAVLRASTNNDERKAASAQMRLIQERSPQEFLQYTFSLISSPECAVETRFFACTVVLNFLEESWHANVDPALQLSVLRLYLGVAVTQSFVSHVLARKVALVVAVMAKRSSAKKTDATQVLPPLVQEVVSTYQQALSEALTASTAGGSGQLTAGAATAHLAHMLLNIHVFLKEMQTKRIGSVFEKVCAQCVPSLSAVFAVAGNNDPLQHYDVFLFLFKCALRVFGCGVFEPAFYGFLLHATWALAGRQELQAASSLAQKGTRLFEYAVKIQEKMVTYFPNELHRLPPTFFVGDDVQGGHTLFALIVGVVENAKSGFLSDKALCRSLRLLTCLLTAEDGDSFIGGVMARFGQSALLSTLLRHLVVGFLADDISEDALKQWRANPEVVAAQLDVDMDNEDSPESCAEQLFLALTGSTSCAGPSLETAWNTVNQLLTEGNEANVTAALHAIGIGYYTMAVGQETDNYVGFLTSKLLPLLSASLSPRVADRPSLFVLRRVVWLIGMWCESVPTVALRQQVHAALDAMLEKQDSAVIILVALHSIENFVSDDHFTLEELPPTSLSTIFATIERVMPHVTAPPTVKALAGLVHVLIEKEAVNAHGSIILNVFAPCAVTFIQNYEAKAMRDQSHGGAVAGDDVNDGDDEMDDEDEPNVGALGMILDCLGSGVRVCGDDNAVWSLYQPIVLCCTTPGRPVTPWVEDYAWELLLTMARASTHFHPACVEATQWCVQNATRDFATLHLALRSLYTLVVLRQGPSEDLVTDAQAQQWFGTFVEAYSPEVHSALTALLTTIARLSSGPLRRALGQRAVTQLCAWHDIQSQDGAVGTATLLAVCMFSSQSEVEAQQCLAELCAGGATPDFPERLVLLLDVVPSPLVTSVLCRLLMLLRTAVSLTPDDAAMVQTAVDGALAQRPADVASKADWGEEEDRPQEEMLIELLGDEEVSMSSPHVARVVQLYRGCLI